MMRKVAFYVAWGIRRILLGHRVPLNCTIILTDRCNLDCRHCTVSNLGYTPLSLPEVERDLRVLYATGSRIVVITGGEPLLWQDAEGNRVEEVISLVRELGFFRTVICTNGTLPLESTADYLWVSLDGFPHEHNAMRGSIYDVVVRNIASSSHPGLYVNYTISSNNQLMFTRSAESILALPNVRGILFHLYTPYLGGDDSLMLSDDERADTFRRLFAFKRRHPVRTFNTVAGLRALARDTWRRPTWASVTINNGTLTDCCCRAGIYDDDVCRKCGCTPAVETWVLQTLKPSALVENLRYL
jgi:MoaA/NifB/PqqE/SkfB family radical SAM enzyme